MNILKKHLAIILPVGMIVLVLGGIIFYQEQLIRNGQTVILQTRPVDPRDLLKGEYVILRYAIEQDPRVLTLAKRLPDDAPIYVRLKKDKRGVAQILSVSDRAPQSYGTDLYLVGVVNRNRVSFPSIGQFYVPEGAGLPIERLRDKLHVEVVLKDGKARVINLLDEQLNVIDPADYIDSSAR